MTQSSDVSLGDPETDYESRKVLLRAERHDTIRVEGRGEFTVARRSDTYYGPKLLLDDGEQNYLLTCPGPHTQLQFWEPVSEDGFISGWTQAEIVEAELTDTKQYDICRDCGEPLASVEHERAAAFGVCPGGFA